MGMSATAAGCGCSVGMNFGKEYYKMIVNAGYRGKVGAALPKFTYTGEYNTRKDGVVELLTSGTLTFLSPAVIDRFMVGGGGAGGWYVGSLNQQRVGGGGGGGYTRTDKKIRVQQNIKIPITIGEGGKQQNPWSGSSQPINGGATMWGDVSVAGGVTVPSKQGTSSEVSLCGKGGDGGSGGGAGVISNSNYGVGGSNGNNGEASPNFSGGAGQGTTTREFGESGGKLYGGGGGGGRVMYAQSPVVSMGGAGGGGTGGWASPSNFISQAATDGVANTGGGGGGGTQASDSTGQQVKSAAPGNGGSGIICFRAAK